MAYAQDLVDLVLDSGRNQIDWTQRTVPDNSLLAFAIMQANVMLDTRFIEQQRLSPSRDVKFAVSSRPAPRGTETALDCTYDDQNPDQTFLPIAFSPYSFSTTVPKYPNNGNSYTSGQSVLRSRLNSELRAFTERTSTQVIAGMDAGSNQYWDARALAKFGAPDAQNRIIVPKADFADFISSSKTWFSDNDFGTYSLYGAVSSEVKSLVETTAAQGQGNYKNLAGPTGFDVNKAEPYGLDILETMYLYDKSIAPNEGYLMSEGSIGLLSWVAQAYTNGDSEGLTDWELMPDDILQAYMIQELLVGMRSEGGCYQGSTPARQYAWETETAVVTPFNPDPVNYPSPMLRYLVV